MNGELHDSGQEAMPAEESASASTLATISLVFGILSVPFGLCLVGFLFGVAAIVLGIVALAKAKKGDAAGSRGRALAGIATGSVGVVFISILACIAILAGLALPALNAAREKARRISCASNLKAMGLAFKQYALDNEGYFPSGEGADGFEQLRAGNYLTDYKIFVCPSVNAVAGEIDEPLTEDNISYEYLGSGLKDEGDGDVAIVCDKLDNHKKYGNALFGDGHVQGFVGKKWYEEAGLESDDE